MTDYLYYQDATLTSFENAAISAHTTLEGKPAIALDKTVFYPTGGGQPFDIGHLNGIAVIDVQKDEQGTVWHVLAEGMPPNTNVVSGEIDWHRRFDFMQHHTGQHILSRAFEVVCNAQTVGFHLTENSVTIDLDQEVIAQTVLNQVEDLANDIIYQNVIVNAGFPPEDVLAMMPLRKISDKIVGAVRVVEIGDFDVCACGGTHVTRSGEVGMIKILKTERVRGQTRLEFVCGKRALQDFREKNSFANDLSAQFTIAWQDIPNTLEKLRDENKAANKTIKQLREQVLTYSAENLWNNKDTSQNPIVISHVFDPSYGAGDLQTLARILLAKGECVVLLGIHGEKAHLLFGRSDGLELDIVPYLKQALNTLGTQRGGGRPTMAQGGGIPATEALVWEAIHTAQAAILQG